MPSHSQRSKPTSAARVLTASVLLASMLSSGVASAQEIVTCEPLLVVHTPMGSEGDETAVSITAQAIDVEAEDQWINVAWVAASGVELTAITVLDSEGNATERTEELAQGAATDVAGLWFCGTIESDAPSSDDEEPVDDDPSDPSEVEDVEDPDGTDLDESEADDADSDPTTEDAGEAPQPADRPSAPEPDANTGRSGSSTSDASASTSAPAPSSRSEPAEEDGRDASDDAAPDDEAVDDEPVDDEALDDEAVDDEALDDEAPPTDDDTPSARSEPRAGDDEVGLADAEEISDAQVEVLGVQLTENEGRTGSSWAILLLVLGLGVLAVGFGVSVWRHLPPR